MTGSRVVGFLSLLIISSCADRGPAPRAVAPPPHQAPAELAPVVIVAIDGVRWQEVFEGTDPVRSHAPQVAARKLLPHLYELGTERGAFVGAPGYGAIEASGPNFVSLPGYRELFTGTAAHGCGDNDCDRTTAPTLLDEARTHGATVAAFATWTKLDRAITNAPGAFIVAAGPAATSSEGAADLDASRPDYETANAALAYFEAERPDVFFLGLGEPDEHAHFDDYGGYVAALRHADDVLGRLAALLERDARGRRTHLFITADHGRAKNFRDHGRDAPESARTWLVAAGPRVRARGFVHSAAVRHLSDIAPTARGLLGLDAAAAPLAELFNP